MALVTCANADVLDGTIRLPRYGARTARLRLDTTVVPSGQVTLAAAGGLELVWTVRRAALVSERDLVEVDLVSGAGRLHAAVEGAFQQAQFRDPLEAIADATGETLSGAIAADILDVPLARWTLGRHPAGRALDELCGAAARALGRPVGWRHLPAGELWIGSETWPAANLPPGAEILRRLPLRRCVVIAPETPALLPGVDLADVGRVTAVDHEIEPDRIRTWAWTEVPDLAVQLRHIIRQAVGLPADPGAPPALERLAVYPAEVQTAASDGTTVDLQPDDTTPLTGHQAVPLRTGVPGLVAVVKAGARALVGWTGGDPAGGFLGPLWELGAGVAKLVFNADLIHLGGESSDNVLTKRDAQALYNAISNAVIVANDGGASFKASLIALLGAAGWSGQAGDLQLGSHKIKAVR